LNLAKQFCWACAWRKWRVRFWWAWWVLLGLMLATRSQGADLPWPAAGYGRVCVQLPPGLAAFTLFEVGGAAVVVEGTNGGGWFLISAGVHHATGAAWAADFTVADGATYYFGPWADGSGFTWAQQDDGATNMLAPWSEGFGFGLLIFGFGWILRMTKQIPNA
jgi:hypothetical protein